MRIIVQPATLPDAPEFKPGDIVQLKDAKDKETCLVLVTSTAGGYGRNFTGVCLTNSATNDFKYGWFYSNLVKSKFVLFEGKVTLETE